MYSMFADNAWSSSQRKNITAVCHCVWMLGTELKGKYCCSRCKNWLIIKDCLSLYMWLAFF